MPTQPQRTAIGEYLLAARSAKTTLNGPAVERVLDSYNDSPPADLVRLASDASRALSALIAYLESPGMRGETFTAQPRTEG